MGKKLAFWGDCNGCGYKIIRILEELGGINVTNYCGAEVTSLYYIDEKNRIKCTYNGDLDKEKYVVMTYHDFIAKYPRQLYDIVYTVDNHEEGKIVEIVWDETAERMKYLVEFETAVSWMCADEIFSYVPKDNSDCGTAFKPMKVKSNAVKLVDNKVVDNLDKGKTMNKKLAIKGHPTRGKEIIELLEMMSGVNSKNIGGKCDFFYFFIDNDNIIQFDSNFNNNFAYFTLEEFLGQYPFKVGDKIDYLFYTIPITVKSMSWSEDYCTMVYDFVEVDDVLAAEDLLGCKKVGNTGIKLDKNNENKMKNVLAELIEHIETTPKEELEREFEEIEEWSNVGPTVEEFRTFCECVNKKPKYPTTYVECCEVLMGKTNFSEFSLVPIKYSNTTKFDNSISPDAPHIELFNNLYKIVICRDAYWKIAGEQMGLDGPWKPDWKHLNRKSYCIYNSKNNIVKNVTYGENKILAFPTEEMRDTFYENFKDLIESCKELL